jgi:hypothetical protein
MRLLLLTMLVACGGDDNVHHLPDAPCVPADPTIELMAPTTYACHDLFTTKVTVTNSTCAPLQVEDVKVTGVVTNGSCTPPGPGTFPGSTIGTGLSGVIDVNGGAFCCFAPGPCPTPFQCDETFTITLDTPAGPLVKTENAHLSLDACDVVCP